LLHLIDGRVGDRHDQAQLRTPDGPPERSGDAGGKRTRRWRWPLAWRGVV
jgi:hypothetical protein